MSFEFIFICLLVLLLLVHLIQFTKDLILWHKFEKLIGLVTYLNSTVDMLCNALLDDDNEESDS